MRLWVKITAICISVIFAVMSICFFTITQIQANSLRGAEEENAKQSLIMYSNNIISASSASGRDVSDTTLKSIVSYYFSYYSRIVETEKISYSLVCDGEYLFDRSPYDPYSEFTFQDKQEDQTQPSREIIKVKRINKNGDSAVVGVYVFYVANQTFEAYISVNANDTEQQILKLRILSAALLVFACAVAGVSIALSMRRTLSPIEKLTENSVSISNGDYHLRTNYKSNDEIGVLSVAFDKMADSIEEKITSLDMQLQKQQLLLGALSHEMRTPMTAIIGYADSLLRMPLNDEQKNDCAQKIYNAGKHTENLTQKMMELVGLSETEQIKKEIIDTASFAEELSEFIPDNVKITYDIKSIYGDKTLLVSMALNLTENALRASGDNPEVSVKICDSGQFYQIIVSDKGCGIDEKQIPLIMEPFYRVDKARSRKHGGAGLGLAICQRICQCHGGHIEIKSKLGEGTTVIANISKMITT